MLSSDENRMDSSSSCSTAVEFDFPDLVLREIFLYSDIRTLGACKQVCTTWKNHINSLEKKPAFLYNICKKEISASVLLDILDKIFPDHWQNQYSLDWKEVYACWYQWSILFGSNFSVKPLISGLNGISCMQVSGEWLLISTCQRMGKLIAVRLRDSKAIEIYVGTNPIINFELVNCETIHDSNITTIKQRELESFFDTLSHNEIWLEYKYCYVQLGRNYVVTSNNVNETIRHSYGYRLKICDKGFNQVLYLQKVSNKVKGPLVMEKEMPVNYKGSVNFWANKIAFNDINNSNAAIEVLTIDMQSQEITNNETHISTLKSTSYHSTYSWQNSIFFTFTDGLLVVHNGRGHITYDTPYRKGYITSILFYCNHLLMGTNRGLLMIYKVDKPEKCSHVYPFITESYNIQISSDKIIRIAVAEPIHHKGRGPMILCASPEKVFEVTFPELCTK